MMLDIQEKRSLETSQSVAQIGFCSSCNRTSNSLNKCDNCGSLLARESASWAFSSDPKRFCKDNLISGNSSPVPNLSPVSQELPSITAVPVQNSLNAATNIPVNGMSSPIVNGSPHSLFFNSTNLDLSAVSAPHLNSSVISSHSLIPPSSLSASITSTNQDAQPHPQGLYLNINNNQLYNKGVNSSSSHGVVTSMNNQFISSSPAIVPQMSNSPHPQLSNILNTHSLTAINNIPLPQLPSHSLPQTPPVIQTSIASGNTRPSPTLSQSLPAATPVSRLQPPVPQVPQKKILIQVQQIQIGLKGFLPGSGVQFTEDGVSFTLRGHQSTPLMLNFGAILKFRANLSAPFPALFFYLEASCIKQIRDIFKMKESDFDEKSPYDRMKCVAFFPVNEVKQFTDIFKLIKRSPNCTTSLFDTISSEEVLDFLYGTSSNLNTNDNDATAVSQRSGVLSNQQAIRNSLPSAYPRGPIASHPHQQSAINSRVRPPQSSPNAINQHQTVRQLLSSNQSQHVPSAMNNQCINGRSESPPTIVMSTDKTKWQQMQNLRKNGIYRVDSGGQKKNYLWTGTQWQPYHVPNVETGFERVRIGSLIAPYVSPLNIDNGKQQISFSCKHSNGSKIDIVIPFSQTIQCSLSPCLSSLKLITIFIYVTDEFAFRIRNSCGMTPDGKREPFFQPSNSRNCHKYLVFFLKELSIEQEQSIMKMKVICGSGVYRPLVADIDVFSCLKLCADIEADTKGLSSHNRMEDIFGKNCLLTSPGAALKMRELLKDVACIDFTPPPIDDDDDDLVMTNEEVGIKCCYTQQVMKEPIKNKHCGHNYEKAAIVEFISRKYTKNIEPICPYAGCGNKTPLNMNDLQDNHELKLYISNSLSTPS